MRWWRAANHVVVSLAQMLGARCRSSNSSIQHDLDTTMAADRRRSAHVRSVPALAAVRRRDRAFRRCRRRIVDRLVSLSMPRRPSCRAMMFSLASSASMRTCRRASHPALVGVSVGDGATIIAAATSTKPIRKSFLVSGHLGHLRAAIPSATASGCSGSAVQVCDHRQRFRVPAGRGDCRSGSELGASEPGALPPRAPWLLLNCSEVVGQAWAS